MSMEQELTNWLTYGGNELLDMSNLFLLFVILLHLVGLLFTSGLDVSREKASQRIPRFQEQSTYAS